LNEPFLVARPYQNDSFRLPRGFWKAPVRESIGTRCALNIANSKTESIMKFLMLALIFFSSAGFAGEKTSLMDLVGHSLTLNSVHLGLDTAKADCDSKSIDTGTARNWVSFGEDSAIILRDSIVCKTDPNFNVVGVMPADEASRETHLKVVLEVGTGTLAGIFSKEASTFRIISENFESDVPCMFKKNSKMAVFSPFGQVTCTLAEGSTVVFDVH
jgi:hypothetical protein